MHKTALMSEIMVELESHHCLYRTVLDQMPDVVAVVELDGTILFVTPSIDSLLGRGAGERLGKNLFEFVHPDDIRRVRAAVDEAARSGEPARSIEYRCRHRDGDWRVVESVASRWIDGKGVMRVLVLSRDATERAGLEQDAHAKALQEAASVSGSIARDFNDLLIVLAREVAMLESAGAGSLRGDVRVMRAAIDRAGVLVNQLLTFAQLDDVGRIESADVNRTLEEMAADLERLSGRAVEVIHLLGATEPNVSLSRTSLERVFVTLVAHARNAMPAGGRLTILTRNTLVAGATAGTAPSGERPHVEHVVIEFTDTGTNRRDDDRARAVDPAVAGPDIRTALHAVHAIIERAGGRVTIDSENDGTTVRVQLPVVTGA
jgi:PAS domain S-box-containing protein